MLELISGGGDRDLSGPMFVPYGDAKEGLFRSMDVDCGRLGWRWWCSRDRSASGEDVLGIVSPTPTPAPSGCCWEGGYFEVVSDEAAGG